MEREGRKEAEGRKYKAEDQAASRGMQMFLKCGKRLKDGQKIPRTEAKTLKTLEQNESDEMTTGRTQEIVPPKNDLSSFTYVLYLHHSCTHPGGLETSCVYLQQ